eukprot:Lithocolla_globosa_v1_NODE_1246_length_2740_cov_5.399628.p1 type:complete len:637 gc:universal NODE_1246_length_2740_cov_5.399628:2581-671(-)
MAANGIHAVGAWVRVFNHSKKQDNKRGQITARLQKGHFAVRLNDTSEGVTELKLNGKQIRTALRTNAHVRVKNLVSAQQYNGCKGRTGELGSDRCVIILDNGKKLRLKPENFEELSEDEIDNVDDDEDNDLDQLAVKDIFKDLNTSGLEYTPTPIPWRYFLESAKQGRIDLVQFCLQSGIDINQPYDNDGCTALFKASEGGHSKMVDYLLQHGACTKRKTRRGTSVLHFAVVSENSSTMLESLISYGAKLEALAEGRTPLNWAVRADATNQSVGTTKALLKLGANVLCVDFTGETLLHVAAGANPSQVSHLELVELLLEKGCDPLLDAKFEGAPGGIRILPSETTHSHDVYARLVVAERLIYNKNLDKYGPTVPSSQRMKRDGGLGKTYGVSHLYAACHWCGSIRYGSNTANTTGKIGELKSCSGCKQVGYCDQICQKLAWPSHKPTCKKPSRRDENNPGEQLFMEMMIEHERASLPEDPQLFYSRYVGNCKTQGIRPISQDRCYELKFIREKEVIKMAKESKRNVQKITQIETNNENITVEIRYNWSQEEVSGILFMMVHPLLCITLQSSIVNRKEDLRGLALDKLFEKAKKKGMNISRVYHTTNSFIHKSAQRTFPNVKGEKDPKLADFGWFAM